MRQHNILTVLFSIYICTTDIYIFIYYYIPDYILYIYFSCNQMTGSDCWLHEWMERRNLPFSTITCIIRSEWTLKVINKNICFQSLVHFFLYFSGGFFSRCFFVSSLFGNFSWCEFEYHCAIVVETNNRQTEKIIDKSRRRFDSISKIHW